MTYLSPVLPIVLLTLRAAAISTAIVTPIAIALAALAWWIAEAFQPGLAPSFVLAYGAAMLFGAGLALAATPWPSAHRWSR